MATMHNLQSEMQLDKNMSTLSGGQLNSHSRKVSNSGKQPVINKPQGGVFQSGPAMGNKLKTGGGPHNILTNNLMMGSNPSMESPQFVLHNEAGNSKFNFATSACQQHTEQHTSKSAAALSTTDHLKTPN